MNTVTMKNVEFGAGVPKICVPICGKSKEDVLEQAKIILDTPADIIEWRMDWFEQVENTASVVEMAKELREVFKETPVLATFRSKKEGGELEVSTEYYVELNCAVAKSGYVDAVDVELYTGDKEVETIITTAHENGVKVIMSNHDFFKTPSKEEIIKVWREFSGMPQELGLPNAPKHFIQYIEEDNRPQVSLDVNYENGFGISLGRLREDTVFDYKFVGLSHNTVRGAAGGAVLIAELLKAKGYITAK